ncbi:MAG: ATP-binding protein [Bacteroidia bacterium]|nr:ATP-binding protein [Bacteroidia bacterium]
MKNSPFIYGVTVTRKSFTNRENEIKKLTDNLLGGINTMIISPRRWGKSSLVEKVADLIKSKNPRIKVIILDLFAVNTEEEFMEKFATEVLKASSSKWEEWVKNAKRFFKNIVPKIQISVDPVNNFTISFDWQEIRQHGNEILNLPEAIAKQKKIRMIICLDEFQSIAGFRNYENFEKKLRSVWQRQKDVTYCIYGSKRHMMSEIFDNPSKPFYRFGDIIMLPKIEREKWISFICDSFAGSDKVISNENAGLIADLMQCHSWYVQQLSHYTWNNTQKQASKSKIDKALNELKSANLPLYQRDAESLSPTQLNLLKAVAHGELQLTSVSVMNEFRLGTPHNVSKNKEILINLDIIEKSGNSYVFLDPVFELWFRESFT